MDIQEPDWRIYSTLSISKRSRPKKTHTKRRKCSIINLAFRILADPGGGIDFYLIYGGEKSNHSNVHLGELPLGQVVVLVSLWR